MNTIKTILWLDDIRDPHRSLWTAMLNEIAPSAETSALKQNSVRIFFVYLIQISYIRLFLIIYIYRFKDEKYR